MEVKENPTNYEKLQFPPRRIRVEKMLNLEEKRELFLLPISHKCVTSRNWKPKVSGAADSRPGNRGLQYHNRRLATDRSAVRLIDFDSLRFKRHDHTVFSGNVKFREGMWHQRRTLPEDVRTRIQHLNNWFSLATQIALGAVRWAIPFLSVCTSIRAMTPTLGATRNNLHTNYCFRETVLHPEQGWGAVLPVFFLFLLISNQKHIAINLKKILILLTIASQERTNQNDPIGASDWTGS